MNEYTLKIGELVPLKKSILASSHAIVYAGMPNEKTFSLAITYTFGNQKMGYNLFYPIQQREIDLPKGHITVFHVSPDSIRLRIG